jgi:putative transposase
MGQQEGLPRQFTEPLPAYPPYPAYRGRSGCIKEAASSTDYLDWQLASIYYQLMRDRPLHCPISCFYKYCRLLDITRPRRAKKNKYKALRADATLKMLHMDVTVFKPANGSKCYLHVIRDNFSRAILGCKVAATNCSKDSMKTLRDVLLQYNLMDMEGTLITDDGVEYKGELRDWLARAGMLWKQMIAQLDIAQSNSMVEAANIETPVLHHLHFETMEDLIAALPQILKTYNNRPALCLHRLTPQEVLVGKKPDKNSHTARKAASGQLWIVANQKVNCGKLAYICMDSG